MLRVVLLNELCTWVISWCCLVTKPELVASVRHYAIFLFV